MSQLSYSPITLPTKVRTIWIALPALLAVAVVTIGLVLSGGGSSQEGTGSAMQTRSGVDESSVAAAIAGASEQSVSAVDESSVAASIGGASQESVSGVDESRVAASISTDMETSTDETAAAELRSDPHGTAIALRTQ